MIRTGWIALIAASFAGAAARPAAAQSVAATPASAADANARDDIIVTHRAERLYRTDRTSVGKSSDDPLDIAQSVQVIDSALIADLGARDVTDLYRTLSGVTPFSYGGVTFRGFRQDQSFFDGQRGNPFIGFSVPQLFTISRVEVLKGPAGLFFGPGAPGGVINYVSKQPQDTPSLRSVATIGDHRRAGLSSEASGAVDRDHHMLYRLGGFVETVAPFRFNQRERAAIGDGGLTLRPDGDGALTLQATVYDHHRLGERLRGVPVDARGRFLADRRWNAAEPDDALMLDAHAYQARYATAADAALHIDAAVRAIGSTETQHYHEPVGLLAAHPDLVAREFRDQRRCVEALSFTTNVATMLTVLGLDQALQAGADSYRERNDFRSRILRRNVAPLSLSRPRYGTTGGDGAAAARLPFALTAARSRRAGGYLQDRVTLLPGVELVGGVRYDRFADALATATIGQSARRSRFGDARLTYRAGALYRPGDDLGLYASWSNSFEPQPSASQASTVGGPFAPVTGAQWETGAKTRAWHGRVQASAALYRIVRRNTLQVDPTLPRVDGQDQLRPIGAVTSRGGEIDLTADLTRDWLLLLDYAYNDARVTGSVAGQAMTNAIGTRFANAPRHTLGVWTRYQIAALDGAVALGADYVSPRLNLSGQPVRAYATLDATLTRQFGRTELMLRAQNLLDTVYASSGFSEDAGNFPGAPRSVFAELRRRW